MVSFKHGYVLTNSLISGVRHFALLSLAVDDAHPHMVATYCVKSEEGANVAHLRLCNAESKDDYDALAAMLANIKAPIICTEGICQVLVILRAVSLRILLGDVSLAVTVTSATGLRPNTLTIKGFDNIYTYSQRTSIDKGTLSFTIL